jgi:predicted nucleic acid-binding protein
VTGSAATSCTSVRFVDTSILLYAISRTPADQDKAGRANALLDAGNVALSLQVLQEFYVQSTRESQADRITHEQAVRLIESLLVFPVAATTTGVVIAAMATRARFKISYWNAAIIGAARARGCEVVLSEDLGDGQDYAGVRVENPFRAADA